MKQRDDLEVLGRYEHAVALRAEKLALLKEGQKHNQGHPLLKSAGVDANFLHRDIARSNKDSTVISSTLVNEAEPWLNSLTDEELSQVHWMTDYGAMESNTHMAGKNTYALFGGLFSAESIESRMVHVDSALKKFHSGHDEVVYRGLRKGMLPDHMVNNYHLSEDVKKAEVLRSFQVGSTYKTDFYMPTSVQPEEASRFADFGCVLEIKTRRAAPVSAVSMVPRESEKLIGRGSEFKVLAVEEKVTYGRRTMTVIQLEQVS